MKPKLVIVHWADIAGTSTYWRGEETPRTAYVTSVGWIYEETKEVLSIMQSVTDDTDQGGLLTIPKKVISKRRTLRY